MKRKITKAVRKLLGTDKLLILQDKTNKKIAQQNRLITEIYYANLFNSVISGSKWLKDQSFAPGRWAVDYAFLYTLFRILNEKKPKKIVEFGLGQTTRMIRQSCEAAQIQAIIYEHDKKWLDLFANSFKLSNNCDVCLSETEEIIYKGYTTVRYKGNLPDKVGKDVEIIVLDGPLGSPKYSRIQIIDLIPECLNIESFIILIDDYQRTGEKDTAEEIMNILAENHIEYIQKLYSGYKDHLIICSLNNSFFASL